VSSGGGVPLVGPQEELRGPSGYTPRGFISSPGQEAKKEFSGFIKTGEGDLFLGPLEWVRAETGGADRWVLYRRGFPGVARVYSPPCLWDTHNQFSIKTLLSKTNKQKIFWGKRYRTPSTCTLVKVNNDGCPILKKI